MNPHELLKAKQKNKANEKIKANSKKSETERMRRIDEITARRAAELTARIKAAANARKKRNNETRKRVKNALSSAAEGIEAVTSTPAWMSRKLRGKFWNNNNE
jgi:vacuolar-type H+-ATPase subunit E/Vma4